MDQLAGSLASLRTYWRRSGQVRPEGRDSLVVADPLARLERRIMEVIASLTFDPLAVVGNVSDLGMAVVGVAAVLIVLVGAAVYVAVRPEPLGATAVAMVAAGSMMSLALWVLGVPFLLCSAFSPGSSRSSRSSAPLWRPSP